MWLQPAMPSTAPQESSSQSSSSMARPSLASLACRERRTFATFGRKPWKNPWSGRHSQEDRKTESGRQEDTVRKTESGRQEDRVRKTESERQRCAPSKAGLTW